MPRLEDLPLPAQNEIRAQRGDAPVADSPEKRRMTLLQRLASVGLGRREGEPAAQPARPARPAPPSAERAPQRPLQRPQEPQLEPPPSAFAKRPQGLDVHGRQLPVHSPAEEDQLEIPAFLRRQAN